jgi:type IV secretory pathway component VirB8
MLFYPGPPPNPALEVQIQGKVNPEDKFSYVVNNIRYRTLEDAYEAAKEIARQKLKKITGIRVIENSTGFQVATYRVTPRRCRLLLPDTV